MTNAQRAFPGKVGSRRQNALKLVALLIAYTAIIVLFESLVYASTADRVAVKLHGNSEIINSLKVTIKRTVKNIGNDGNLLQDFSDEEQVWISKKDRVVKRKIGGDEQTWDCRRKWRARLVPGGTVREPYEGGMQAVMPSLLVYLLFPQYVLDRISVADTRTGGNIIVLIGRPKGFSGKGAGDARWELEIDRAKGVIMAVRTFDLAGRLAEEMQFIGWQEHERCWLPSRVTMRRSSARNDLTIQYELADIETNVISEESLGIK